MSKRAKQLLATYPNAEAAVAWCELVLRPNSYGDDDPLGEMVRKGFTVESILRVVRETMQECVDEGETGRHTEALQQTYTGDFQRYLAGLLGMV